MNGSFISGEDGALGAAFLRDGYVVDQVEDMHSLARIRDRLAALAAAELGKAAPDAPQDFLDSIHKLVPIKKLNEFRVGLIGKINAESWVREAYYRLAEKALHALVGNELAMQRRVNLSIQLPDDESSLLPAHADTWSGDSPFEVVLWLPMVDCFDTKSMFVLPPEVNARIAPSLAKYEGEGIEALFREHESEFRYLTVNYGQYLLFDQNLIHGNRINREKTTRWTFNCRFKGLFTPYADKKLGEFFEPITLRPATRLGLNHRPPGNFRG